MNKLSSKSVRENLSTVPNTASMQIPAPLDPNIYGDEEELEQVEEEDEFIEQDSEEASEEIKNSLKEEIDHEIDDESDNDSNQSSKDTNDTSKTRKNGERVQEGSE